MKRLVCTWTVGICLRDMYVGTYLAKVTAWGNRTLFLYSKSALLVSYQMTRVARFFLAHNSKTGQKGTKWIQTVPNGHMYNISNLHKIFQMAIKYTFSNLLPSKINPNWDFGFENKPSGNPAYDRV
jgi:hypothetical protein